MEKRPVPATLSGRCANGYERGQGRVVHAVMCDEDDLRFGVNTSTAICGKKHGARSAGWCARPDLTVTCQNCIKLQSKFSDRISPIESELQSRLPRKN
jgi:hypothetical protein